MHSKIYHSVLFSVSVSRRKISAIDVTTTTTAAPHSFKDTTALYISLMGGTHSTSSDEEAEEHSSDEHDTTTDAAHHDGEEVHDNDEHYTTSVEDGHTESSETALDERVSHEEEEEEVPVEQRLRELTDDLGKLQQISSNDDETRQSFLSLSDLIKNLRQDDDKPLQIDSSYSRSKVLGEKPDIVYHPRNTGDVANRSLFKK
jgi:hypothetical protein